MSEKVRITADLFIRHYRDKLQKELSNIDIERLDKYLNLFGDKETASLEDCLKTLYPLKDGKDALSDFRGFRFRVNEAAESADLEVCIEVDDRRKSDPSLRESWITGENPEAGIAQFTRQSTKDVDIEAIKSNAIKTTGKELEEGKRTIRLFAFYCNDDHEKVEKLLTELKTQMASSRHFIFKITSPEDVPIGYDINTFNEDAISKADYLMVFLSQKLLTSKEDVLSLKYLENINKPIFPISLNKTSEDLQSYGCLDGKKMFYYKKNRGTEKSYCECNRNVSADFVLYLFEEISNYLNNPSNQTGISCLNVNSLRNLVSRETEGDFFVDTRMAQISLESGFSPEKELKTFSESGKDAVALLVDWATNPNSSYYTVILGESGIGKTTTLKQFANKLLDMREKDKNVPLPIFIDLRTYSQSINDGNVPLLEVLLDELIKSNWKAEESSKEISAKDILKNVNEDGAILIFDGLDEKMVHLNERKAREFIRQLWSALYPVNAEKNTDRSKRRGKLMFSCRSHYFKSISEQGSMLRGEDRDGIKASDYSAYILLPFDEKQIREYLDNITKDEARTKQIIDLFNSIHNLNDLAQRPYLLSLMVRQIEKLEALKARGEIVQGVTIYNNITDEWMNRDSGKHHIRPEHKRILMEELSAKMWSEGARELPWEKLQDWLLERITSDLAFKSIYILKNDDWAIIEEDFRTATFVLRPDNSDRGFRFAHTSLQEYFLASHLFRALEKNRLAAFNLPMPSLETLEFLGQLIITNNNQEIYLKALETLMEQHQHRASLIAFGYLLIATGTGLPLPKPKRIELPGEDLSSWNIYAFGGGILSLPVIDFQGAILNDTCWENVSCISMNFRSASLISASFEDVTIDTIELEKCNIVGSIWHHCNIGRINGSFASKYEYSEFIECCFDSSIVPGDFEDFGAISRCGLNGADKITLPNLRKEASIITFNKLLMDVDKSCSWSPDGKYIATGSDDNTIRIWDATGGKCLKTLEGHNSRVNSCYWSPDGLFIASGSDDNTVRIWEAAGGKCLKTLEGHDSDVYTSYWSPDGKYIATGSDDNTIRIWDAAGGKCLKTLEGHNSKVRSCSWSPDGKLIASASWDRTIRIWDAADGKCLKILEGHSSRVKSCSWSPNGKLIASGSFDNTIRIWDATDGKCIKTLEGHDSDFNLSYWSPDGKLIASGSYDNTIRIWDAAGGKCLTTLEGHNSRINSCSWSLDGKLIASGSDDNTIRIWDVAGRKCLKTLEGHYSKVKSCSWSPNGNLIASTSWDRTIRIWDAADGKNLKTLEGHNSGVNSCSWSPDKKLIASTSWDRTIRIWDAADGKCLKTLEGHDLAVNSCSWSPDGKFIASGGWDNTIRIWDAADGKCLKTLEGHNSCVKSCSWSPDGMHIASVSDDNTISIWNVTDWKCLKTLKGLNNHVNTCSWSPDAKHIASGGWYNTIRIWDVAEGKCLKILEGHNSGVNSCSWSPDGKHIASGSDDNTIRIWNVTDWKCLKTLKGHNNHISTCSWSPDGKHIASGGWYKTIRIWDVADGKCLKILEGHVSGVNSCSWSPDGKHIVSGSSDSTIRIWDIMKETTKLVIVHYPQKQWATIDMISQVLSTCSVDAWRYLAWKCIDEKGVQRLLPAEHFGPLPVY